MAFNPLDLKNLTLLSSGDITKTELRVIIKPTDDADQLGYISIDQLVDYILGDKLTLAAPAIVTPPSTTYTPNTLNPGDNVSFTVQSDFRTGFVTGTSFIASAPGNNNIKCTLTGYDTTTGILTGTVVSAQGAGTISAWTVAYLTSFFTADTIAYTPSTPYDNTITNVQAALEFVGSKINGILTTYETVVTGSPQTRITPSAGYNPQAYNVFYNGERLLKSDYVGTNGTYIDLNVAAPVGTELVVQSFQILSLTGPIDAATLQGQAGSYYRNPANMTAGTLAAGTVIDGGTFP